MGSEGAQASRGCLPDRMVRHGKAVISNPYHNLYHCTSSPLDGIGELKASVAYEPNTPLPTQGQTKKPIPESPKSQPEGVSSCIQATISVVPGLTELILLGEGAGATAHRRVFRDEHHGALEQARELERAEDSRGVVHPGRGYGCGRVPLHAELRQQVCMRDRFIFRLVRNLSHLHVGTKAVGLRADGSYKACRCFASCCPGLVSETSREKVRIPRYVKLGDVFT